MKRVNQVLGHLDDKMSEQKNAEEKQFSAMLQTTLPMPMVGLGTWQAKPGEVGAAVTEALKIGYKHIDCAAVYGNEKEIGEALQATWAKGAVKRSEIFITSKVWNSEHNHVRQACEQTLKDLQTDYLDLYLVHWPHAFEHVEGSHRSFPKNEDGSMRYDLTTTLSETWRQMEECLKAGLCRAIGLSNFTIAQMKEVIAGCTIRPPVLQVENHPFFAQKKLLEFCKSQGISMTGYSPLGSGTKVGGEGIPMHAGLAKIGEKYKKSAAQVALRYQLQRGLVIIPKSVKPERIAQNLDITGPDFQLSEEDMKTISDMDSNQRATSGWGGPLVERNGEMRPRDELHPNYPFVRTPEGENDATVV